jgi:hypothetical protein
MSPTNDTKAEAMLTLEESLEAARAYLADAYAHDQEGWVMVVVAERSYPYHDGWIVYFNTQEALESGLSWKGPVNKLLVVPGDGSTPYGVPTTATAQDFRDFRATGVWPPGVGRRG